MLWPGPLSIRDITLKVQCKLSVKDDFRNDLSSALYPRFALVTGSSSSRLVRSKVRNAWEVI